MSGETPYFAAICARERLIHTRTRLCEDIKVPGLWDNKWHGLLEIYFVMIDVLFYHAVSFKYYFQERAAGQIWRHYFCWDYGLLFFPAPTSAMSLQLHCFYLCANIWCGALYNLVKMLLLVLSCVQWCLWYAFELILRFSFFSECVMIVIGSSRFLPNWWIYI
jgi:hypothetical protein